MASRTKVLLCDGVAKKAVNMLSDHGLFDIEETKALPENELVSKLQAKPVECLVVRSSTTVTRKVFESQKGLKLVGRAGVGVDNIDVTAAGASGVKVMNTPGGNANAVVELTLGFMLALARHIPQADRSMKSGKWEKKAFKGIELKGKILGLIGVGRIGYEVAKRAGVFGMSVLGYDPYLSESVMREVCDPVKSPDEIYRQADFISIHTPLTAETRGLIGSPEFDKMKEGVRIINAARGGILDEKAMLHHMRDGKVAGAALDVYSEEPPTYKALLQEERVILTPHIGAATEESQDACAEMLSGQIIEFFTKGKAVNVVN